MLTKKEGLRFGYVGFIEDLCKLPIVRCVENECVNSFQKHSVYRVYTE